MTERVVLHVGGPKSGTTYLQAVLREHAETLAGAGVLVAGREQVDLVHAAMVLRGDARLDGLPPRAHRAWDRLVDEVAGWSGEMAVVSYELFSNLEADAVRRALEDLAPRRVDVVVTARDLGRSLSSAWQERLKFGVSQPLERFTPPDDDVVDSEWGWRTLDPSSVAQRWGATLPADRVHVVTVPRDGEPGELWRRFADAAGLEGLVTDPAPVRANESLDVVSAEVLRRTNPHLRDFLRTPRERAVWSRDLLANRVLAPLGQEPLALGDAQLAGARERYEACRRAVVAAGWVVHGDLADLEPVAGRGRSPREVSDAEVAQTAVRALAALLRETRNDSVAAAAAAPAAAPAAGSGSAPAGAGAEEGRGLRGLRSVVTGASSRAVAARADELHARVDELERALDDRRRLQQRLAMLTDLVGELLLPLEEADPAEQQRLAEQYRRTTT
ncbi:hypothetical protein GCM10009737_28770 [Nocardioides lentus]|uniref:DUF6752 domain-containing protein n=1 Tax=Nocardioides lentus TaxID=338077 RepID=A0ABP5B0U9_9ACTN